MLIKFVNYILFTMGLFTLLISFLILECIFIWEIVDKDGLEEFVEVFYGRLKEIVKGEF